MPACLKKEPLFASSNFSLLAVMGFFLLKYIHIIAATLLVGSVFTIDAMTLKLIVSKKNPALKTFHTESKFMERAIIGPSSIVTTLSGIIMAMLWFGWPFWLTWGLIVVAFTGLTGSITIPKLKRRLVDLISSDSPDLSAIRGLTGRFIFWISLDFLLLLSAMATMVYKPAL